MLKILMDLRFDELKVGDNLSFDVEETEKGTAAKKISRSYLLRNTFKKYFYIDNKNSPTLGRGNFIQSE